MVLGSSSDGQAGPKSSSQKNTSHKSTSPDSGPHQIDSPAQDKNQRLQIFRAATQADVLRLKPLALEYHAESRYAHIPFSDDKFMQVYSRLTSDPKNLSIYAQLDGQPVGLLGAQIGDYFLGQDYRIATTYVVYVSGAFRSTLLGGKASVRLIRVFSDWARAQGSKELNIHATSGIEPEHTDRFLRKLGFSPYGGNYAARIG